MKISIRLFVQKTKINKMGKCPIRCRITYNKELREFATGQFINPNNWYRLQQQVAPPEPNCDFINIQLSLIKTKINKAFLFLQVNQEDFSVLYYAIYLIHKGMYFETSVFFYTFEALLINYTLTTPCYLE